MSGQTLNVLSLFSGIGGLELGLERAGMTVVGQVELDPYCRRVLAKHWPEVPRHDDVRTAPEWWASVPRPAVDLVCGGFPCQPVSLAGRGKGQQDERWGWPWFADVIRTIEPAYVLIENVPGLVRRGLLDVLRDLADLGFDAWWDRYPAAAFGAPHLRWRLFVTAAHPERLDVRLEPGWGSRADGSGTAVAGHDGSTWSVADADYLGRHRRPRELGPSRRHEPEDRGSALADTDRQGQLQQVGPVREERGRSGDIGTEARGLWAAEPDVGRVAHGVPARVDRLRALGNAVVPQVAEHVGRLLMAAGA